MLVYMLIYNIFPSSHIALPPLWMVIASPIRTFNT